MKNYKEATKDGRFALCYGNGHALLWTREVYKHVLKINTVKFVRSRVY